MLNKYFRAVPFLVLTYFFLHFIVEYFYFVDAVTVTLLFLKYLAVTAALYFIGYKIFRNKEKYTLVFSSMLFIFLFFGSFIDTLIKYNLFKPVNNVYLKYCLGYLGIGVLLIILVRFFGQNITRKFLKAWMIYCLVVIAYDTFGFIFKEKNDKKYVQSGDAITINPQAPKPHVYFLLFDMYASDDVYRKHLRFDNSEIHSFLANKGFYVTRNAKSLYDLTHLSLSSTLNLEPISYLSDSSMPEAKKAILSVERAQNSSLVTAFKNAGYKINNFSFFNLLGNKSPLNFNLEDHVSSLITGTTLYNRVYYGLDVDLIRINRNIDLRFFKPSWSDDTKHDLIYLDTSFNRNLIDTKNSKDPTFNYFHFMMPHPPIIYDSTGKELPLKDMYSINGFEPSIDKFTSFTRHTNNKIKVMVNEILKQLDGNAIIILQGDHGYREFDGILPDEVRYGIFNSVYLPNKNYNNFSDTIRPIETLKQVLVNQFNSKVK